MALGLPISDRILTHGHWTIGREKMSKSVGNVVNPFHVIDLYGVDIIRYYLALDGSITDDADYNNMRVVARYKELQGALGNLATRVTRSKKWNVREAIVEMAASSRFETQPGNKFHAEMWSRIRNVPHEVAARFEHLDISGALKHILELTHAVRSREFVLTNGLLTVSLRRIVGSKQQHRGISQRHNGTAQTDGQSWHPSYSRRLSRCA